MTSTLIGASSVEQLEMNAAALDRLDFTPDELTEIDRHATESDINLWAASSTPRAQGLRRGYPPARLADCVFPAVRHRREH